MKVLEKARAWLGHKVILLGVRVAGVVLPDQKRFSDEVDDDEGEEDDNLPLPYPPVGYGVRALELIASGINSPGNFPPPPAPNEERPLKGSAQDRMQRARRTAEQ